MSVLMGLVMMGDAVVYIEQKQRALWAQRISKKERHKPLIYIHK